MNIHLPISWIRQHWILSIVAASCILVTLYLLALVVLFGYELGGSEATRKLADKAVSAGDPAWCTRMIYPNIMMGPAKYEFINNCLNVYAKETGDVSVCMSTMSPDSCVLRIAENRNKPELCAQAIDPRRQGTDGRGKCFGYFAERERDYHYCEQLLSLSEVPESQNRICISNYIGRDKSKINLSLCESISTPDLREFCIARVRNSL